MLFVRCLLGKYVICTDVCVQAIVIVCVGNICVGKGPKLVPKLASTSPKTNRPKHTQALDHSH
ncbi:hypothetical protein AAMO2058_001064000 [Amorphochlora amoebiformis]